MTLTQGFLAAIAILLVLGVLFQVLGRKAGPIRSKLSAFADTTPGLLTTIGVFGTFVGILIGLREFDVERVDESVPMLLDGLKTAFWSSVGGMAAAITFRLIQPFMPRRTQEASDDPIEILQAIERAIAKQTNALSGGEDTSLLTQIQKFRTGVQDGMEKNHEAVKYGFEKQIVAFETFAKEMAENNSKVLIEALNEVIRDFNKNLTEQFGENFKHLNEAVGKLLEWQERYKGHIEQSESRLTKVLEQLDAAAQSIAEISKSIETMPERSEAIRKIIEDLGHQLGLAGDMSKGLADLQSELKSALPAINSNIDTLTTSFSTKVEEASSALQTASESAGARYEQASDQLTGGINRLQDSMEQSFSTFDDQMQKELIRALELMGTQLASISEKLAVDYEKTAVALKSMQMQAGD
jgi:chromosome segregation ATPase